ncbi:unnamed protein product [Ambrosiozyma monospora]|uniref:Unnamed protein product n=1 Tax=Ambrosiozyma monospora TaxID=43982 RepID=A0A9W6YYR5_AMBMO|nr:unnamed protein product [Ambrosiozyma monospora]
MSFMGSSKTLLKSEHQRDTCKPPQKIQEPILCPGDHLHQKLGSDTIYNSTAEIMLMFISYNRTVFAQQQQQQHNTTVEIDPITRRYSERIFIKRHHDWENQEGPEK